MKILIAPDSFKGTMSSKDVIDIIANVLESELKGCEWKGIPIADGGEGTVHAILSAIGGEKIQCDVFDPLGREVRATYGLSKRDCDITAIIEMAEASGLMRLNRDAYNLNVASTYGTGELLVCALNQGASKIVMGIGGSATNDAGTGFAKALGVRYYDRYGQLINEEGAQILGQIEKIDLSSLDDRLTNTTIEVICDVINPLTGPSGATKVFGPQKGLLPEQYDAMEAGMCHYKDVLYKTFNIDVDKIPGTGAAGGLGATLVAIFGAKLKPGIDSILDLTQFDTLLKGVDLVITGEGRIDGQSIFGKVPVGIAKRCTDYKKKSQSNLPKVVAIAGCDGPGVERVYDYGIDAILTTVTHSMTDDEIIENAKENLRKAAVTLTRLLKL